MSCHNYVHHSIIHFSHPESPITTTLKKRRARRDMIVNKQVSMCQDKTASCHPFPISFEYQSPALSQSH